MAATAESARVAGIVGEAVASAGLVLEGVKVTPAGKRRLVRIVLDLPDDQTGSVDLDQVAEVSRAINTAMDAAEPFGQTPYVLEVSSPGVDRPLTERRHWSRARGRLVKVAVGDGPATIGRVVSVDDAGVRLETEPDQTEREIGWQELGTGRVQVEFSHHDDTADDDTDDGEA